MSFKDSFKNIKKYNSKKGTKPKIEQVNLITDTAPPSSQTAAQTRIDALTTIVVNEPIQSDKAKVTSQPQKPIIIDEMITETTKTTTHLTEIHTSEELTHVHDANTGELNNEIIEAEYTQTYDPENEQMDDAELDRKRHEFAGNYSDTLVLSAIYKEQRPISDELKHLLKGEFFNLCWIFIVRATCSTFKSL